MTAGCGLWQNLDLVLLQTPGVPMATPADVGLAYENVRIPTAGDNTLDAWYVPAVSGQAVATVTVYTGMQGNLDDYLPVLSPLAQNDFNVLVFDWQGYGASDGMRGFANFEPDMRAVMEYLLARPEPASHKVVQLGVSLGAICALGAAAEYPEQTAGVIVYGPFFPDEIASRWLAIEVSPLLAPIGRLGDALFISIIPPFMNPRNHIPNVHAPIMTISPEDDSYVPFAEQMNFYAALPEPKQLYVTYGDHRRAIYTDPELPTAILTWLYSLESLKTPQ